MGVVIEVASLRKSYGRVRAVEDVSFSVEQGGIFGLIGPNGAGRSRTCRSGLRCARPSTCGRASTSPVVPIARHASIQTGS